MSVMRVETGRRTRTKVLIVLSMGVRVMVMVMARVRVRMERTRAVRKPMLKHIALFVGGRHGQG